LAFGPRGVSASSPDPSSSDANKASSNDAGMCRPAWPWPGVAGAVCVCGGGGGGGLVMYKLMYKDNFRLRKRSTS
jgi:hypothetical protein